MLACKAFEAWVILEVALAVTLNDGDVEINGGDEKDPEEGHGESLQKSHCKIESDRTSSGGFESLISHGQKHNIKKRKDKRQKHEEPVECGSPVLHY
jgi:hypothetical protein